MASNSDRRSSSSASRPSRDARGLYDGMLEGYDDLSSRPSARRVHDPRRGSYYKRMRLLVTCVVMLLLALVVYVVVVYSPLFEIERITANPTEHVTSDAISSLAAVPSGSTLFSVDEAGMAERLAANPWIASVKLTRDFPHTLVIEVQERTAAGVVMLANGSEAWLIASDGFWLEPLSLQAATADNGVAAPADQAREQAAARGLVYISEISATVKPVGGTQCADEGIMGVLSYLEAFGDELRGQIVSAKASSRESVSVVLSSGIEISLGAPTDIALKEQVALAMLSQYAGQITYLNVLVPTDPVWRGLDAAAADTTGETAADSTPIEEDPAADAGGTSADGAAAEGTADPATDGAATDEAANGEPEQTAPTDAATGAFVGTDEGGPGGLLDEGGYYADDGVTWIYAYHDANGNWINGYYDSDGAWVQIS